jgi:hypothetical protein
MWRIRGSSPFCTDNAALLLLLHCYKLNKCKSSSKFQRACLTCSLGAANGSMIMSEDDILMLRGPGNTTPAAAAFRSLIASYYFVI